MNADTQTKELQIALTQANTKFATHLFLGYHLEY